MKVKVPRKIKIGTHIFTIEFDQHMHSDDRDFGQINYRTQTIKIWKDAPPSLKREALIHEVLHLSQHIYRVEITDADIDRVAQVICDFLENNLGIEFVWDERIS